MSSMSIYSFMHVMTIAVMFSTIACSNTHDNWAIYTPSCLLSTAPQQWLPQYCSLWNLKYLGLTTYMYMNMKILQCSSLWHDVLSGNVHHPSVDVGRVLQDSVGMMFHMVGFIFCGRDHIPGAGIMFQGVSLFPGSRVIFHNEGEMLYKAGHFSWVK